MRRLGGVYAISGSCSAGSSRSAGVAGCGIGMTVPVRYLFSSVVSKAISRCSVELAAASLTFATRLSLAASRWIARSTSEKV